MVAQTPTQKQFQRQTPKERHFALIRRPLTTEKSTKLQAHWNKYSFEVAPGANKTEVKKAVESLFSVHVESVRMATVHGKMRRIQGRPGRTPAWKKAIVTLRDGETIEIV